jgi:FG-GAP-like repeat
VDVDRSGQLDLLVANRNDSRVSVLLGRADGTFAPQVPLLAFPAGSGLRGITGVDFDKDNATDLAVTTSGGIQMLWGVCQ